MRLNSIRNLNCHSSRSRAFLQRRIGTASFLFASVLATFLLALLLPHQASAQSVGCTALNSSGFGGGFTVNPPLGFIENNNALFEDFALGEEVNWTVVSSGAGLVEFAFSTGNDVIDEVENNGGDFNVTDSYTVVGTGDDRDIYLGWNVDNEGPPLPASPGSLLITASCTAAPPTVTTSTPNLVSTNGGTTITIAGTNLLEATAVTIGGTAATSFVVNNANQITAIVPTHAAGAVNIVVTTPGGVGTGVNALTYVPPPTLTSSSPNAGPVIGGTTVTIIGTNFTGTTAVSIAGTPVAGFTVNSAAQITAVTDAGSVGTGDIVVTTPGGSATLPGSFTYVAAPTITSISPPAGPVGGGTSVTIIGTNFSTTSAVSIGGSAASFSVNSPTQITVTTPAGSAGAANVVVTTVGGPVTLTGGFTYVAAPTITSISPTSGSTGGGTTVVITGTNFSTASVVTFGASAAPGFTINSATQITATTPTGSAGPADVGVTTAGGPATLAGAFTYAPAPTITSISPDRGPLGGGTTVVITGTNLSGASAVSFGGVAATGFTIDSATQITATTPAGGAGPADVVVTTLGGPGTLAGGFTYVAAPTVTSISPTAGPVGGGTTAVIIGTNFSTTSSITFGGTDVAAFTVNSATQITVTTPAGSVGPADVIVMTSGGAATLTSGFTYVAAPTVKSITPAGGSTLGGETVVLTGTNLAAATGVDFGGVAAASFTIDSPTQISVVTPAHPTALVTVNVVTPGGTASAPISFSYFPYGPTIASVAPASGSTLGGDTVVITGTYLNDASAVMFGSVPATSFTVDSPTQITAVTPANAAGPIALMITTPGGTEFLVAAYTYVVDAPTVSSVSPSSSLTSGGGTVVITGTNLLDASAVSFGGTAATSFTVDSATQISAVVPSHVAGSVDVVVTTPGGTATLASGFTYTAPLPFVFSTSPATGSTLGGTTVTIGGTSLIGATSVTFGGVPATSYIVNSPTQITAVTGPRAAGTVNVTVVTAGGSGTLSSGFTYVVTAPTVSAVSPSTGSTLGGTSVTITGTNLTGATAVDFGGTAATSFTIDSATQITAVAPAGAAGAVDVTVTSPSGTGSLPSAFTYVTPVPALSGVSPSTGTTLGGTSVTITGTDLTDASSVTFGGTAATSFSVDSPTQITATTPAHGAGAVDVVATTPGGTATLVSGFTYVVTAPTVSSVAPSSGSILGGTTVTITGTNLAGASAVTFGGAPATSYTVDSATQITAVTPARAAGPADVIVTTPAGSSAVAAAVFTYVVPLRPDPSLDPEVVGLISAQATTATRFARTQMRNFHGRLERLHNERERRATSMNVRLGLPSERGRTPTERLLDRQASTNPQRFSKTTDASSSTSYGYGTEDAGPISGIANPRQTADVDAGQSEYSRLAFWSGGFVNFGDREGSGVNIDHTNIGVSGGFDYRFSDRFVAGLGIGYSRDRTDIGSNGTESEAHAFSAAIYSSFEPWDNFFIDGLLGGGTLNFDSRRYVTATGDFAIGERDGSQVFGSLTAAYELREETWLVSPYGRIEFSRSWLDSFTETGGGIFNLTYGKQTVDSFSGVLGVRANKSFEMDWGTLKPGVRAEYTHDFDGSSRARLGYADLGGLPYTVELQDRERDYLTLGLSLEMQFVNNWDLLLDYRVMLDGEGDTEHTVGAQLSVRF